MKWLAVFMIPAAIAGGVFFGRPDLVQRLRADAVEAQTPELPAAAVAHRPARKIFAAGTVEGATRDVELSFEIEGRLQLLPAQEGGLVSKGEVLARLDDTIWKHRLAESEAKLELARAERERLINGARTETREVARTEADLAAVRLKEAESDLKRANQLAEQNAISREEHEGYYYARQSAAAAYASARAKVAEISADARTDEIKMADARIQLAEAEVLQAKNMLEKTVLVAPDEGVVLRVNAENGELIQAHRTEPLLTMTNINELKVRAYVEELDAMSVEVGQAAYVTADGAPDHRYTGKITWIAPSMEQKRVQHQKPGERLDVKVREVLIALDDPAGLVVGLPVDVFIEPVQAHTQAPSDQAAQPPLALDSDTLPLSTGQVERREKPNHAL